MAELVTMNRLAGIQKYERDMGNPISKGERVRLEVLPRRMHSIYLHSSSEGIGWLSEK
jgi:hypothetical protein